MELNPPNCVALKAAKSGNDKEAAKLVAVLQRCHAALNEGKPARSIAFNKEELAIKEANVLGIPVIAILDSNVSPDGIAFPVPANDDAARAIRLYCEAIATASSKGNAGAAVARGEDLGAMVEPPVEAAVVEEAAPVAEEVAAVEAAAETPEAKA